MSFSFTYKGKNNFGIKNIIEKVNKSFFLSRHVGPF